MISAVLLWKHVCCFYNFQSLRCRRIEFENLRYGSTGLPGPNPASVFAQTRSQDFRIHTSMREMHENINLILLISLLSIIEKQLKILQLLRPWGKRVDATDFICTFQFPIWVSAKCQLLISVRWHAYSLLPNQNRRLAPVCVNRLSIRMPFNFEHSTEKHRLRICRHQSNFLYSLV